MSVKSATKKKAYEVIGPSSFYLDPIQTLTAERRSEFAKGIEMTCLIRSSDTFGVALFRVDGIDILREGKNLATVANIGAMYDWLKTNSAKHW